MLNIGVEDSNESSLEYSDCLSEEEEVANDLAENGSDQLGSSCSESITENMRVKTKAKANSSKKKTESLNF